MEKLIEKRRKATLKLAELNRKLREGFRKYLEGHPDQKPRSALLDLGIPWSAATKFLDSTDPFKAGRTVVKVGNLLKNLGLAKAIAAAGKEVPDRWVHLAAFSDQAINLAYDILQAYEERPTGTTVGDFAGCFGEHTETVTGLICGSSTSCQGLESPETRAAIQSVLKSTDWSQIKHREPAPVHAKEAAEFQELFKEMMARCKTRNMAAKLLDVDVDTLKKVLSGQARMKSYVRLITKARDFLKSDTGVKKPPSANLLEEHGGEVSPLGVKFTLGPNSFKEIDGELGDQFVGAVRAQIETARALLNVCAQIKDAKRREKIRKVLGSEVEELDLAIRLFTAEYPNRLTKLYRAQRDTWKILNGSTTTKKGES